MNTAWVFVFILGEFWSAFCFAVVTYRLVTDKSLWK
jgi:hypothetical protein